MFIQTGLRTRDKMAYWAGRDSEEKGLQSGRVSGLTGCAEPGLTV